jgi:glucose/mannose transport system substrate-binding protein
MLSLKRTLAPILLYLRIVCGPSAAPLPDEKLVDPAHLPEHETSATSRFMKRTAVRLGGDTTFFSVLFSSRPMPRRSKRIIEGGNDPVRFHKEGLMRSLVKAGILLAGVGALSACGSSDDTSAAAPVSIELATWWTMGAEVDAVNALIDVHKKVHPEVTIKSLPSENAAALSTLVQNRLATGNPPAAFQANLGGQALQWGPNAQSLNSVSAAWKGAFTPSVLDQLTYNNDLIGVPVALTRQNVAYWNLKVLDTIKGSLTKEIPSTIDEFKTWLTEVGKAGYTHSLCFGGMDSWVVAHVMFEDIVPSTTGAANSQKFWTGNGSTADLAAALDFAKLVQANLVPTWTTMGMAAGIDKLMANEATPDAQCLMTSMGDWGGAQLAQNNAVGTDFTGTGWPGSTGNQLVVFGGDTFVAAKGAANQQAVYDFFGTMASEAGQLAFALKKGSMPARTLTADDAKQLGALTQANAADLAAGSAVPGFKVMGSSKFDYDTLSTITVDFFKSGDSTALVQYLNDNYSLLKQ